MATALTWLIRRPAWTLILLSLACIGCIGIADALTGYELDFAVFYLAPIFLATWTVGRNIGILMAVASSFTELLADVRAGLPATRLPAYLWGFAANSVFFVIMVTVLAQLKAAHEREQRLSRCDSLTGLANRMAFLEIAAAELVRCRRYQHPLTIVYLDCDGFKTINDRAGHPSGDAVLRVVAETLHLSLRATDTAARLGGDEFAVLLPELGARTAVATIERLHDLLLDTMSQHQWALTFSIGAATCMHLPDSVDALVALADQLMYAAKHQGKNRLVYEVFDDERLAISAQPIVSMDIIE